MCRRHWLASNLYNLQRISMLIALLVSVSKNRLRTSTTPAQQATSIAATIYQASPSRTPPTLGTPSAEMDPTISLCHPKEYADMTARCTSVSRPMDSSTPRPTRTLTISSLPVTRSQTAATMDQKVVVAAETRTPPRISASPSMDLRAEPIRSGRKDSMIWRPRIV